MQLRDISLHTLTFALIFIRLTVHWCKAIHSAKDVPVYYEESVLGEDVSLPCDISIAEGPHEHEDSVVLVLWYREDLGTPIFSVDTREKEFQNAEIWSDDKVFGSRAFFLSDKRPARLSIDNVRKTDEGTYRCRVDFKFAQTRNSKIVLNVIVPPQKIIVTDEYGKIKTSVVGPYLETASLKLTCNVTGAKPAPHIVWYKRDRGFQNKTYVLASAVKTVSLSVSIPKLNRSDLHAELTCQAWNNNRTNLSSALLIDMNLKPVDVRILQANLPLIARRVYDIFCQSIGSRPPAKLTWWKSGKRLDKTKDTTSSDGNISTSVIQFIPRKEDLGKYLSCKSENHLASTDMLETTWKLEINYLPETRIRLGASLKSEAIEEGADVYFDCIADALPPSFKVDWKLNGKVLHHQVSRGIIISNYSLVLQRVNRSRAGNYTCTAYNAIGEGESDIFRLDVLYAPICKSNQTHIYGVAKLERVNISCEVEANPMNVVFKWSFNNSQENIHILSNHVVKSSTFSMVSHIPLTEMDYGTLLCFATNKIGQQRWPCVFHVIPAVKPERVSNCSIRNITAFAFDITCDEGFGGGIPQTFYVEINSDLQLEKNASSSVAQFRICNLRANTHYVASVYAANLKGRSEPTVVDAKTLPVLEMSSSLPEDGSGKEKFHPNAIMNVIMGVAVSSIIVTCLLVIILQTHCSTSENQTTKTSPRAGENLAGTRDNEKTMAESLVRKTLLRRGIAFIDEEEKDPDLIPQPLFLETREKNGKELRIATVEDKAAADAPRFVNCTRPKYYRSSCSSTTDRFWRNYALWPHSNRVEDIDERTPSKDIGENYIANAWPDDSITPSRIEDETIDSVNNQSLLRKTQTQFSSVQRKSPKHESIA